MPKRDIIVANFTVLQLLRPPCQGEGGAGTPSGREKEGGQGAALAGSDLPSASVREGGDRRRGLFHPEQLPSSLTPASPRVCWQSGFYGPGGGDGTPPSSAWAVRCSRAMEG